MDSPDRVLQLLHINSWNSFLAVWAGNFIFSFQISSTSSRHIFLLKGKSHQAFVTAQGLESSAWVQVPSSQIQRLTPSYNRSSRDHHLSRMDRQHIQPKSMTYLGLIWSRVWDWNRFWFIPTSLNNCVCGCTMLWGLDSNNTMHFSTSKNVSFDPPIQILMASQCTLLLVTCHGEMLSSRPSNGGCILDSQQGKLSNQWLYIEPQVKIYHHNLLPLSRRIVRP